jgi:NADH dehydrogenase
MAVGDVANMKTEDYPQGLPMLGAVAQQQGGYVAKNLKSKLRNRSISPFQYKDKGTMATIGRNLAVVDLGKLKFGGFLAWITWVFVHLMLLVDFRNRLIVLFNWVWSYVNFDRGTRLIVRKFKKPSFGKKEPIKKKTQELERTPVLV